MKTILRNIIVTCVTVLKNFYEKSPTLFAFVLGVCVGLFVSWLF
jgi:hypothetical protein